MKQLTPKQQHWSEIVSHWQASGLSQAEYCRRHDIDLKRFYSWKLVLEKKVCVETVTSSNAFLPIALTAARNSDATITMNVSGVEICYGYDTDSDLLMKLLAVLRGGGHDQAQ